MRVAFSKLIANSETLSLHSSHNLYSSTTVMEIDFFELFNKNMTLMIFAVIALGLIVGRIKIGQIELGSTTGVLLVGLLFGHFGFQAEPILGTFGFTIFIFAVGLQAGPTFFSVFMTDGLKYILLASVIACTALGAALIISNNVGFDYGMNAGLLAGALTSTPTLVGAQDAVRSGLTALPDGMSAEQALENISVGYAITYIFGTIGLIVFIRYMPVILKIDLPAEARALANERGFTKKKKLSDDEGHVPLIRAYGVPEAMCGKTVEELRVTHGKLSTVLRMRRNGKIMSIDDATVLEKGDVVSVIGSLREHELRKGEVGNEILDPELLNYDIVTKEIVVIRSETVGKTIPELNITSEYGCFVRGIKRASIDLPVDNFVRTNKGDRLYVTGESSRINQLAEKIGRVESEETHSDLLGFSLGIGGGLLLGMVMLKLGNVSIGLGSAGGLLLLGILFGFLRSIKPTFGGVPPAARNILMEFGLVMFMAGVGLKAGGGIVEGLMSAGPALLLGGVVVTLSPVFVGYFFGRKVLKMNPALLLGSITGAMTSTPSLNVITDAAKSEVPALGYAGTYTFANVFLTFAGTIMMAL